MQTPGATSVETVDLRDLVTFARQFNLAGRAPLGQLAEFATSMMTAGAPGQEQLQRIFESVGFTTGGRSDHLYGPWSGVAGASADGMALRNELVDFLLDSSRQSVTVQRLITKIEANFLLG